MSSESLQPGQLIEETYRIVKRIGEGGMGEVYEATHARLAGRYAIKVLLREVAGDPNLMARFQREAQVTSSLRHPNIVQVLDFRQLPSGPSYIVMEFLEGVDLAAEIQRTGPLPLARVRALVDQIASGLSAAHEQGIVHRDLKPANLFLVVLPGSHRELVKIVDFGISKVRASNAQLTRTATIMGTPQYMAPEQALGQGDRIDARADQFSLATIAYEMIAGRCAFVGDTIPTVLYQLVHVDAPPLTVNGQPVSPAIEAVIRRGLSKQPEARYPSVLDFARAFDAAVAESAPSTGADSSGVFAASDKTMLPATGAPGAPVATGARAAASAPASVITAGAVASAAPPPRAAATTFGASASEAVGPPGAPTGAPARPHGVPRAIAAGGVALALGAAALVISLKACTPSAPPPAAPPATTAALPAPAPAAPTPPAAAPAAATQVSIAVEDAPPGLVVSVDSGELRSPPVTLNKGSGTHQLIFQAPGYRARTMQLDSGKDLALVLSMKKLGRSETTAAPAAAVAAPPPEPKRPGRFKRSINAVKGVWTGH